MFGNGNFYGGNASLGTSGGVLTGPYIRQDGTNSPTANIDWGDFSITGLNQLKDKSNDLSVDVDKHLLLDGTGTNVTVDYAGNQLNDSAGTNTVDWENNNLFDSNGTIADDWENRILADVIGTASLNYDLRVLSDEDGAAVFDWTNRDYIEAQNPITGLANIFEVANVDLLSINQVVIIPAITGKRLMTLVQRLSIYIVVTALTGTVTTQPQVSCGNNGTFDNVTGNTVATAGLTAVNSVSNPTFLTTIANVDLSTSIKFAVKVAATGVGLTNFRARVFLMGAVI